MTSKKLLSLVNAEGEILAPHVLNLGQLGIKETIELAWGMTEVVSWSTEKRIELRPSRAPNPGRVQHRIYVGDAEMYAIQVNMKLRTVTFSGPFLFRTIPGTSHNLCDYAYALNQLPTPTISGTIKARSEAKSPERDLTLSKVGSFYKFKTVTGKLWIGQLVEEKTDSKFAVRWLKWDKNTETGHLTSAVWEVNEELLVGDIIPMTRISMNRWKTKSPDDENFADRIPVQDVNKRCLPPTSIPHVKESSKKRMEVEIRQMQSQSKRLKKMVDTLERASAQMAARWNIDIITID